MKRSTKYITSLLALIFVVIGIASCNWNKKERKTIEQKVLSPSDKILLLPYQDILHESVKLDTIDELRAFIEINDLWVVGFKKGIYFINKNTKQIHNYLKFDVKSHKELIAKQDSQLGSISIDFTCNKSKDKLLISVINGISFQVDLKCYKVDWLGLFLNRIETATYSDNGYTIAIGTGWLTKDTTNVFYSSLFLIDSKTGQYIDHFNEGASVKKILFKDNDSKLLVAYDWNSIDSYLWDINKKDQQLETFVEDYALIHDIALTGTNEFVTVNGKGISKWDITNPKERNLVFSKANAGYEKILKSKVNDDYLLIGYSKCYFFDKQIQLKDSLTFPMMFESAEYSGNDSIITLKNLDDNTLSEGENKDGILGFYRFNTLTRELTLQVDTKSINEILRYSMDKRKRR
jgi:hypothetical protein